jgi:hypothetical protein
MPGKIVRSAPRTPIGRLECWQAVHTTDLGVWPVEKSPANLCPFGFIPGIPVLDE